MHAPDIAPNIRSKCATLHLRQTFATHQRGWCTGIAGNRQLEIGDSSWPKDGSWEDIRRVLQHSISSDGQTLKYPADKSCRMQACTLLMVQKWLSLLLNAVPVTSQ